MKRYFVGLLAGIGLALAIGASAQLIHGNTFPFWNVTGPLAVGGNATVGGTLTVTGATTQTGVQTFTAAPVVSALTASLPVFTSAGKALASNAMTGTGNVVMSASPTLTGTIAGANQTLSGTLGVTGITTLTVGPVITTAASPAAAAACTAGKIEWDTGFIYVCTATGVWKRAAITGGY